MQLSDDKIKILEKAPKSTTDKRTVMLFIRSNFSLLDLDNLFFSYCKKISSGEFIAMFYLVFYSVQFLLN